MSTNYLFVHRYQGLGNTPVMSLAENLTRLRKKRKLSQQKLADAVGVRQNTIAAIETGETKKSKYLPDIARVLDVSIKELDPTLGPNENLLVPGKELVGVADLPGYGTVEGGEGAIVMSSEPVETVKRPDPLRTVKDGFGVIVSGDSMVPLVRPGDIVLVHPHLPPKIDDLCLFLFDQDGDFRATIKEFCGQSRDLWKVKRYQPKEHEFTLKKADFPRCAVVVGIYKRR